MAQDEYELTLTRRRGEHLTDSCCRIALNRFDVGPQIPIRVTVRRDTFTDKDWERAAVSWEGGTSLSVSRWLVIS